MLVFVTCAGPSAAVVKLTSVGSSTKSLVSRAPEIVKARGLLQESDAGALGAIVEKVIAENPKVFGELLKDALEKLR